MSVDWPNRPRLVRDCSRVLFGVQFVLPFVLLLSRSIKRSTSWLTVVALLVFLARGVDLYWLIMPAFYPEGFHFHWLSVALFFAIGGIWILIFSQQWSGKAALPLHDPRLGENHEKEEKFATAEQSA